MKTYIEVIDMAVNVDQKTFKKSKKKLESSYRDKCLC